MTKAETALGKALVEMGRMCVDAEEERDRLREEVKALRVENARLRATEEEKRCSTTE